MTAGVILPDEVGAIGPADGTPIVFLHGTRLTRAMWAAQLSALSDEFRVSAVDLPGHGGRATEPFTLDAAADATVRAIEADGGRPAVIVGLSLGGYVAMHLAARRPDVVRGLVLSGASAEPVAWRALPYRGLAWVMERGDRPRLDGLNRWFFRHRFPPAIADPILAGGFWYDGGATALRALVGERFTPRLATYPGPTLFLNGTYDLPFRLSVGAFAEAARQPRRVRLAGATHLANLDRPAAFNAAVRRFVRSLEAPR